MSTTEAAHTRDARLIPRSGDYWQQQFSIRDGKLEEMGFASYAEYLASPGWRERRNPVVHRAAGRCGGCNKQGWPDVHHLHYETLGGETAEDLIALCDDCHYAAHSYGARARPYLPDPSPPLVRKGRRNLTRLLRLAAVPAILLLPPVSIAAQVYAPWGYGLIPLWALYAVVRNA